MENVADKPMNQRWKTKSQKTFELLFSIQQTDKVLWPGNEIAKDVRFPCSGRVRDKNISEHRMLPPERTSLGLFSWSSVNQSIFQNQNILKSQQTNRRTHRSHKRFLFQNSDEKENKVIFEFCLYFWQTFWDRRGATVKWKAAVNVNVKGQDIEVNIRILGFRYNIPVQTCCRNPCPFPAVNLSFIVVVIAFIKDL